MLNICLTVMLLVMPLLLLQKDAPWRGLNTGLWVSLFFWGRLYYGLSILVFCAALFYYIFSERENSRDVTPTVIKRTSMPQFILFLSSMMIFCALGKVFPAYGSFIQLEQGLLTLSNTVGFVGSLLGPIFFGYLSDKRGPFPAMVALILTAAASIGITAYSYVSPLLFPVGTGLLWLSVAGTFVLLPMFMLLYLGHTDLFRSAPTLIVLMTGLWALVYFSFDTDTAQIQHATTFLTFAVYLILTAALFSFLAWKNRLELVK